MTGFLIVAAVLTALALAFVAVPLWRSGRVAERSRQQTNLDILRDQRRLLDLERQRGQLSDGDHEQAVLELEQRVLAESSAPAPVAAGSTPRIVVLLLLLAVPIGAAVLYRVLGMPSAIDAPTQASQTPNVSPAQIAADVETARQKVASNPADAESWLLIARGSALTDRPADAVAAYEKVIELVPTEPEPMLELAEMLSAQHGGLKGRATELIEQALKVAPDYWKALALAGRAAFDRGDYAVAIEHWEKLRTLVPGESTALAAIDDGLNQARARLGGAAPPPAAEAAPPAAPGAERISGTVTLAPALRDKAAADDTVFIFARHAEGPRMPLAVLRKKVSDLPVTFTLDDSMAMSPALRLSAAKSVVVTARVSKSGTVMPGTGDLQGESAPVAPGASGLSIEIANELP